MRRLLVVSRGQRCDEQADRAKVGEHTVLLLVQQADAEEKSEEEAEDEERICHSAVTAVSRGERWREERLVEVGVDHVHGAQVQLKRLGLGNDIAVNGGLDGVLQPNFDVICGIGRGGAPMVKGRGDQYRVAYVLFTHI